MNVELRFYEGLNEFLPKEQRKQSFAYRFPEYTSVGDALERLGVPLLEVELVLVNGESVDFNYQLRNGARMAVYPRFEALDVTPLLCVQKQSKRI